MLTSAKSEFEGLWAQIDVVVINTAGDLSRAANARLLLLDYPLAPEPPFPAGLNALVEAYVALIAVMEPTRMVVGGDSAGGGLVMSLLLALRDRAVALPAGAPCISPWVDLIRAVPADPALASLDPIVSPGDLLAMRSLYAEGCDFTDHLLSPGFADLKGLPPLLIHVGAAEVLLPDSHHLAKRASVDGVDVKRILDGGGASGGWCSAMCTRIAARWPERTSLTANSGVARVLRFEYGRDDHAARAPQRQRRDHAPPRPRRGLRCHPQRGAGR